LIPSNYLSEERNMPETKQKPIWLLGGGPGSDEKSEGRLLRKIFEETGIRNPIVAYIGCASDDNKDFFAWIKQKLLNYGAGKVLFARSTGRKFNMEEFTQMTESSDIIFMSGGDVEQGMRVLKQKALDVFLKKLYQDGKTFLGVSAGSIMLCKKWVRWENPHDDLSAQVYPCLGLAGLYCDTHAEEDNWDELKTLLSCLRDEPAAGYGIPAGGAIKIKPDGQFCAYGKPLVKILKTKNGFSQSQISEI